MHLLTLRIVNCFGFRDSGEVKLFDAGNLVYILGRNSSGKTALLTAIEALSPNRTPDGDLRFRNFHPSDETPALVARFAHSTNALDLARFMEDLESAFRRANVNQPEVVSSAEYRGLVDTIKSSIAEVYTTTITQLNAASDIWVKRTQFGEYLISSDEAFEDRHERIDTVQRAQTGAFRFVSGTFTGTGAMLSIGGVSRSIALLPAEQIDGLLFNQFPRIARFDQRDRLSEDLPETITLKDLESDRPVLGAFLDVLDRDKLRRVLGIREPRARRALISEMQERVNAVTAQVNSFIQQSEAGQKAEAGDLVTILLDTFENGLQITVDTGTRPSCYFHYSDNTKLLFAYYLLLSTKHIDADILLFDEPSNGFHASAQQGLLAFFTALTAAGKQVIVSTHSEYLIDPDHLSGIRRMETDVGTDSQGRHLGVRNKWNEASSGQGDVEALRPVRDAIGLRYGASHLTIHDRLIVTEEPSALHYLRAFRLLFGGDELHINPANGGKAIVPVLAMIVGQGLAFKVVVDSTTHGKSDKQRITEWGGVPDASIYEIAIPGGLPGATGSGIEDVFSKADFKRILTDAEKPPDGDFDSMTNSKYANTVEGLSKLVLAKWFAENVGRYTPESFDDETRANIRRLLDFCANEAWFRM